MTSLLKTKPFDAQLVATIVARRERCDPSVVRARWADATEAGTLLHLAIHNYYNGFTVDPRVTERVEWQYFLNFIRDHPNLRPWRTEFGVFCWRLRLCGTLDVLYFDWPTNTFYVCDWKNVKVVTQAKIQEWKRQIGMYVYMLRHELRLKVTKMIAIVLHSTNTNYVTIDLPLDEAYDAWVDTVVAARLREVQAALDADAAAIVERDAARAVIRGIFQAGEQGGVSERGNSTTTENAGADSTSGIAGTGDLRGKTVSFSGSFPDAAGLQLHAVDAGMTVRSRRTPTDMVVVGNGGEGTVAAAQATARGVQLITAHSFATAAAAAARAHDAGCTAEAAAAAASGAQGWPAAPAAAPTPAAAASNGKNKHRKRRNVNTQAEPRALWCKPGVYVASQCAPWERPTSFADTAATEAAIAREAARIVTFLREHTPAGDELALHAAAYVVRHCEHCWS